MKLHLPIGLRKALMAVFAALAVSPAVATAADNVTITENTEVSSLTMDGEKSNSITSKGSEHLPGYLLPSSAPTVNVGDVEMTTTEGYNAIIGAINSTSPTVIATNKVIMNGAANAVMLGSNVTAKDITLGNLNKTISVGEVVNGIMPEMGGSFMPADLGKIEGIFNIVQGSNLHATTGSVTMNTATTGAVNNLKVNVITGGHGDISELAEDVAEGIIDEKLTNLKNSGYLGKLAAAALTKIAGGLVDSVVEGATKKDFGSTITAGTNITMGGGASVIVDTTLSDLAEFAKDSSNLKALLEGNAKNSTPVTLTAGKDINLNSIINMAYAAQGGVNLSAGTADGVVGAINATGALNVVGGKTTLTADNINFTPGTSVSFNQLAGELPPQLSGFLPINDIKALTGKLGDLADVPVSASIVAGGANLTANGTGDDGNISLGGTAGIVVNTKVTDVLGALGHLQNGHELLFAKSLLESGTATKLEASRDINMGAQLNVLHGGGFTEKAGENALTITAGNDVNMHGFANVVSGNVQMKAGDINMKGDFLEDNLAAAVGSIANGYVAGIPGGSTILSSVLEKGNVNVVTGGATLEATGNIKLYSELDTEFKQASAINAVLDTQLTDVITAVINGEPNAILPTDKDVFKPTTTLKAGGNIDLLGRVNVVNGLRGNVVVDAKGDVNLQGNISMVSGNSTVTGKNITINTVEDDTYKMHLNAKELQDILPVSNRIANAIADMGMVNAAVVAGGADLTATEGDITTGGTVGLLMNTPVADAIKELNPLNPGKNPSEYEIIQSLLQKGEATTLTATNGNINVGSQFNLMHGGGFTEVAGENALVLTAGNAVNVQGTANVVSGNVQVNANTINMTGEVLPNGMSTAANALAGILADKMGVTEFSGVLGKLVQKGSVNMVTGGATLDAEGDITMTAKSVDDVGKIGNINAVIDTEIVDVLQAKDGNFDSLVQGGGHTTTLTTEKGSINLEGRVNLVNGTYVKVDAGKDVNLQGNISMIGGATVNAGTLADAEAGIEEIKGNININTSEDKKYKMYIDSSDLGDIELPLDADTTAALANTGVNAAIVAGGAKLNATQDINIGGTAGLVVNTPATAVMDAVMTLMDNQKVSELLLAEDVLNAGVGTTLNADRDINLGADFNLLHGGNFSADGMNALVLTAGNAVNVQGTGNVVSGNVQVNADTINMTGERLTGNMADVAGALADSLVGGLVGDIPGADIMLDKLVDKGSVNVVTGGATLTAKNGITMSGVHETGAINAVLDTELTDLLETVRTGESTGLVTGGYKPTTLIAENGDITMEGRLNLVNGGMVTLKAENGTVNLNGSLSFIGGDATVTAQNIKLNDDETGKYQMYFDSEELGAILPAGSPITELMNTFGITDLLGTTGVNAALVAGGSNLTATGDITTGGTVSMLVNTPMTEVMKELETWTEIKDETWMVNQLLQKGTATTVQADGNINLASRLNLMHGGNFGKDGANALSLTAGKDVKMNGSANVVSGNVIVKADNDITMTGEALKFDMESGVEMLDKLAAKGSTNIVTGGATLKATGNIKLDSMANFVLDTEATNVTDAFMEQNLSFLEKGGNKLTSLNAGGNIDLVGRLNVVNGAYVALNAGKDVNISGTLNMVSGKAKVNGNNINITGQTSVGLNWDEIIPGVVGGYAEDMGITDKLNKGVNGSFVLGGATLTAKALENVAEGQDAGGNIKLSGKASVVTNVPLGSAFEALTTKLEETWQPEIWLMKDMLNDGVATTLTADGNIEMDSRLNVLHGGNMGNANAALVLKAGQDVKIAGTANIISGNTQVTGQNITVTGKTSAGFDWDQIADALPGKYVGYGDLAGDMGILAKLEKGVNGSVIAGGATLTATTGDITMEGMATAVVDVTTENVLEAVETMNGTPIMEGGTHATTIKAKESINLNSRLNLVNGGKVTLNAGQNVNMNGTFNTVSGNANVIAGGDINMKAQNKVGVDITPVLNGGGHYADIATELGMADMLKNGVSSNIVAGGAYLEATTGNVKMIGDATAIVDTTASNVIGAVKGDNLGELMKGGRDTTEVKAGGNIELASQMNLVNGGNTKNAGGVLLSAGNDVIVGGQVSVVNRAKIEAGQNVNFNSGNTVLKYSDITAGKVAAGKVAFTGETAEITDVKFNNASVDVLGTQLVNTLGSDVLDIGHLNVAEMGSIENLGSLTVQEATLSGATLYNAGSIIVSDKLTLDSATLSFVADENNVTLNHTAIVLGDGFQTLVDGSSDMLAGLHFELNYGALDFIADDSNVFDFKLALFEGITEAQTGLLDAALADGEFSITLTNGFRVDGYENVDIVWENNVAYVTGSASVPEPTTATLSLLALAALAARRRRK